MAAHMPLSWNEIRQRAITFSKNWSDASRERAESQTFWNEFFDVFGIRRRTVASFEEPVRNLRGDHEFIDLFWPGKLIAEHKSRGRDLDKASTQANGYCLDLLNSKRREEMPRYILVSDFARFALHDLEAEKPEEQTIDFPLSQLHKHIRRFAFIAGYETRHIDPEDPANLEATKLLANVHDRLEEVGYTGHDLQRFMVRILFCLFADDTGIFEPDSFKLWLQNHTREDGSDLGTQLSFLFRILDTPGDKRPSNLDEDIAAFPYVNGELYREKLDFPVFDSAMRIALIACASFHWEKISPAVFGSLFQSVMDDKERRQIGAHYTSERDILKLIRSLFLDDLRAEFESIKGNPKKLEEFHRKLGRLKLLDPACGCGNFLVLSYRELRRLEMDVLQARFGKTPELGDILSQTRLNVGQFYGIEIEEWPVRIAEVALWLMDHQMNRELFERFGGMPATIPLRSTPHIRQANALRLDWNEVLPASECSYVLGNPPFVGKHLMTPDQEQDMALVWGDVNGAGFLDYVSAWYLKAARFIEGLTTPVGLVSTNSICQGEQVGILWNELFHRQNVKIHFAHRTFAWESEARGKAHVHVVIVGFGRFDRPQKSIHDYDSGAATVAVVHNISPYLVEGPDIALPIRRDALCDVPEIINGNKPVDGGHLIMEDSEREAFLRQNPEANPYLRPYVSAEEFINGSPRWVLWLKDAPPEVVRRSPGILDRLHLVRQFRLASRKVPTRKKADTPALFDQVRQPTTRYLVIPKTSSERRRYIPIAVVEPDVIASTELQMIPAFTLYHFGVLTSTMHMAWMRQVCGRLKSDYRYSNKLVYNNYPWPQGITDKQKAKVEECAQAVLDARTAYPNSKLADLYDPLSIPAPLANAHADLDRAVDACYRSAPFTSERHRVEYLFALYGQLIAPLTSPKRISRRSTASS